MPIEIVFDPAKDAINRRKHGISLRRAEDFDVSASLFKVDDSQDYGEIRYKVIGWLDARLFTLIFTPEGTLTRPISLRKATKQEQKMYAEEI